jgi:hypothetical protein
MQQEVFIENIRQAYLDAREVTFSTEKLNNILSRGTSKSISSISEDLFGCYCAEKVQNNKNIKILVDPPLSFKGTGLKNKSGKRSLLIRPDVVISKDKIANCFFDLKTDLGFKRFELFNKAKAFNETIEKIKKHQAHHKDGKTKASNKISFSKDLKLCYVILSSKNITNLKIAEYIERIKQLENIELFILTSGSHLNVYSDNFKPTINQKEFDNLDNFISSKLN